jgi:hypothetical protein
MSPVMRSITRSVSKFCPVMPGETLIAGPYSLGTIGLEGVPPSGGVSISSGGFPDLLTLPGTWSLGKGVICREQNSAS